MTMNLLQVYFSTTSTRKRKKFKKSKSLLKAEIIHQKFLKKTIRGCSSVGRAVALQATGQQFDSVHLHQSNLAPLSNDIPVGIAKKKEVMDHNFTIAPAYNKGAYQVISKNSIKDIGR